jgi:hypothetical protein
MRIVKHPWPSGRWRQHLHVLQIEPNRAAIISPCRGPGFDLLDLYGTRAQMTVPFLKFVMLIQVATGDAVETVAQVASTRACPTCQRGEICGVWKWALGPDWRTRIEGHWARFLDRERLHDTGRARAAARRAASG